MSIYVGENHQYHSYSVYSAILDYLFFRGVSGATVIRGIGGFGADHHLHTTRILDVTENLPIKIEFIESPEKVDELLPKLHEMVGTGLIEIQDTMVNKPSEVSRRSAPQDIVPTLKREGKAKLMRIYRDNKNVSDERGKVCVLIPRWARKGNVERRVVFA